MIYENKIKDIAERIAAEIKPRRIVLFGSQASGNTGVNSDIDLCIIEDSVANKNEEFIRVRHLLKDIIMPMDIIILNKDEFEKRKDIWGTVQYEIDKKGIIVYER